MRFSNAASLLAASTLASESMAAWMASGVIACGPRSLATLAAGAAAEAGAGAWARVTDPGDTASHTAHAMTMPTLGFDRVAIQFERQLQVRGLVARKRHRILPCVA